MTVKRIVVDIATDQVGEVRDFYMALFDFDIAMDQGWITTLAAGTTGPIQLSIASQGGSGTSVPDVSIEVDDVDQAYQRAKQFGHHIPYDLTDEPWGVRRFYVADPTGKILNVLAHIG